MDHVIYAVKTRVWEYIKRNINHKAFFLFRLISTMVGILLLRHCLYSLHKHDVHGKTIQGMLDQIKRWLMVIEWLDHHHLEIWNSNYSPCFINLWQHSFSFYLPQSIKYASNIPNSIACKWKRKKLKQDEANQSVFNSLSMPLLKLQCNILLPTSDNSSIPLNSVNPLNLNFTTQNIQVNKI